MFIRRYSFVFLPILFAAILLGLPTKPQYLKPQNQTVAQAATVLNSGPNVNMVSGTQLPYGDPWLQRQNEPSIAVSTRNPLHLLGGANDYRTIDMPQELPGEVPGQEEKIKAQAVGREPWLGLFKSFDGGQTWITTLLPGFPLDYSNDGNASPLKTGGWEAASDPVVRAGPNGLFYYSGIAFHRDTKVGVVFISRFIDNNNREMNTKAGDCIKYLDTKIIAMGSGGPSGIFLDKPWIAVDIPRLPFSKITVDGQSIQEHNVYIAFSAFTGEENTLKSKIMFARSNNCGETWSTPIQVSKGNYTYQGATIAIHPILGAVFVAWRKFGDAGQPNQEIYVAKSITRGLIFQNQVKVASFYSFDQASSGGTFRTNSYPTMAVDSLDRVYVAWSQRMGTADARAQIVISASLLGNSWRTPTPIDNSGVGHQIMPSLTFAGGKVMAVWYDQRDDYSGRFTKYIDDLSGQPRHTLDVRVAQADPSLNPVFEPSLRISRYRFYLADNGTLTQAQFNPVNYPLFKNGTWPFMGDYIDISPSPMFVLGPYGYWRFNNDPSYSTVFHVAWTDNRDVRPPTSGTWQDYGPPNSLQSSPFTQTNGCNSWENAGMRNQNVYTSAITEGIIVGCPGNTKPLGTLGKTPDGKSIPRAFVVFVRNTTSLIKSFRLTFAKQPKNGRASFLEFEDLRTLDVKIAPYSSISRAAFVDSTDRKASVEVDVAEIDMPNGQPISGGLTGYVVFNPEIENPEIENPDLLAAEVHNPEIENPEIINWDYRLNPEIINPEIINPEIINPEIINPEIENPEIINPEIENPEIINPEIENPNIPDPTAGQLTDVIWKLKNAGNTASSYIFKTLSTAAREDGTLPGGIMAQLLVYRVYKIPALLGSSSPCDLREQQRHELMLNVTNPEIENPEIENPEIENPEIENPEIENATFNLEPNGEALVLLRLWKPNVSSAQSLGGVKTLSMADIIGTLVGYASGTSRNTQELKQGVPTYPDTASALIITTKFLSDGKVGQPYSDFLTAAGGKKSYTWSIINGILPAGLSFNSTTGEIYGTPTAAGTSSFTIQVTDYNGDSRTQDCWITILGVTGGGYTISGRVTVSGSGLPGVTMGGLPVPPVTDSSGYYSSLVAPNWSGTVTPTKTGYTFTPASQTYTNVTSNWVTNYAATIIPVPHTVSTPTTPTGPASGFTTISYTYASGGSTCSAGHNVEYKFDWGDGNISAWSSSTSASHSWASVGTYNVKAQARCSQDHAIISSWSAELAVTISNFKLTVVYIYQTDTTSANSFKASLAEKGIVADLLHVDSINSFDFSGYSVVLIGNDTGSYSRTWGGVDISQDDPRVIKIVGTGLPVIAIGTGNFIFDTKNLDLNVGAMQSAVDDLQTSILKVDPSHRIWNSPNVIGGTTVDIYQTAAPREELFEGNVVSGVVTLARCPIVHTAGVYYPIVSQDRFIQWGFRLSPDSWTQTGKDLFENIISTAVESYEFVLKWGSQGSGDGQFNHALKIEVDSSSNVYVVDPGNARIQKFTSDGTFITKWGSLGGGDGQFNSPCGIAVDNSGNVYVADVSLPRIQKFTSTGVFVTKWGSSGNGDGQFSSPRGIEVDSSGNVYVADQGNDRIQKFTSTGVFVTKWGSNGSGDGQFDDPNGIAVDSSGNVYVADTSNNRIQKFTSDGVFVTKWGSNGSGDGQFGYPEEIAVDSFGNVYVADTSYHRIQKFTSVRTFVTKWGTQGSGDGQFYYPQGIAVDSSGNVYVADTWNNRVQKFRKK